MKNRSERGSDMPKEQYSDVYTLRSIQSEDEMLEFVAKYSNHQEQFQIKSGHWTLKEHIKYIMFLDYFSHLFELKHNKKLWKIFTVMSNFIKTRNSSQCRSHHQKTERKYPNIEEILKLERAKYKNYSIQFEKMKKILENLPMKNPEQIIIPQRSTDIFLPSVKIHEEQIGYKVYNQTFSEKKIIQMKTGDHENYKSEPAISENRINFYDREKYIGSQCSIQMQDQNEEGLAKQVQPSILQRRRKVKFNDSNYKLQMASNPYKSRVKFKDEDNEQDQPTKISANKVKIKKTRSLLPTFQMDQQMDGVDGIQKCIIQKSRSDKRQSINTDDSFKCRTSPLPLQKQQDNFQSERLYNQPQFNRNLFSGFVSSIENYEIPNQLEFIRTEQFIQHNFTFQPQLEQHPRPDEFPQLSNKHSSQEEKSQFIQKTPPEPKFKFKCQSNNDNERSECGSEHNFRKKNSDFSSLRSSNHLNNHLSSTPMNPSKPPNDRQQLVNQHDSEVSFQHGSSQHNYHSNLVGFQTVPIMPTVQHPLYNYYYTNSHQSPFVYCYFNNWIEYYIYFWMCKTRMANNM